MNEQVYERIRQILAEVFNFPLEQIKLDSSPDTIPSWDSLQHMNMIMALEQEFDRHFTLDEIERLTSVQEILKLLEEKLGIRELAEE